MSSTAPTRPESGDLPAAAAFATQELTAVAPEGGPLGEALRHDHAAIDALMQRLQWMAEDEAVRAHYFPKIRSALRAHMNAEAEVVHPALNQPALEATRSDIARAQQQIHTMLQELHMRPYDDPDWPRRFAKLADCVRKTMAREEAGLMPAADMQLDPAHQQALRSRFGQRRRELTAAYNPH